MELLQNNAGCRLPCWWGIEPGSPWADAQQSLLPFVTSIRKGEPNIYTLSGMVHIAAYYSVEVREPDGTLVSAVDFGVTDGIIDKLLTSTYGTNVGFRLAQVLTTYGPPDEVLVDAGSRAYGYVTNIVLSYPQDSFVAYYEYEAQIWGENYRMCPYDFETGPMLWAWLPGQQHALDEFEPIGSSLDNFRSMQDATGLDIQTFYDQFKDMLTRPCLETPISLWP